ncbi:MAG: T9SS type A sorting domain-containing protein, partial [candidate division Zixibacteria bacterium]|nr:T9SS type A sorting domain-containing protein [candidate division Zixibacteria bacterium]
IYAHGGTSIPEGNISGTWTKSGSPYYIEGDVTVPTGESLTIEAGVEVIFKGWYHFYVHGLLQADGTQTMSITFTPEDTTNTWRGMRISDASDDTYLKWCTLEFGDATGENPLDRGGALYVLNTSPTIENSTFRKSEAGDHGGGIYLENAHAVIDGCTITENTSGTGTTNYGGGMSIIDSNPTIRNSEISNNNIYVSGSFSSGRGSGGGIYLDNSDAVLEYNIISNNEIGGSGNTGSYARGAAIYAYGSDPEVINNTITGNVADLDVIADEQGGVMYITVSDPVFVNSILWDNTPQDIFIAQDVTAASVMLAYCDMQGGQDSVFYGDNGTLYWQEGNIDSDPLFIDASQEDYHLSAGSPCIDAGTAYYEWNGDVLVNLSSGEYNGSAPDMGALESGTPSAIKDEGAIANRFELNQNYPNPFNPATTIQYNLSNETQVELTVFNLLGQQISTLVKAKQAAGQHEAEWNPALNGVPGGVYFYRLKTNHGTKTGKMIYLP